MNIQFRADDGAQLEYLVVKRFDDIRILPTRGASPLRCNVLKWAGKRVRVGCQILVDAEKGMPPLNWHLSRGYSNVNESTLQKLADDTPELPAKCLVKGEESDRLAVRIIMHQKPGITEDELSELMHKRQCFEDNCLQDQEEIPVDVMDDVLKQKDRKESMSRQAAAKASRTSRAVRRRKLQQLIEAVAPDLKKSKRCAAGPNAVKKIHPSPRKARRTGRRCSTQTSRI